MADPLTLWHVCQGRAMFVEADCPWQEHREYTRNREAWQEKLPRSAGPVAWGDRTEAGNGSTHSKRHKPRQSFRYVFGLISRPYRIIVTLQNCRLCLFHRRNL